MRKQTKKSTTIRLNPDLKQKAIEQGLNISKLAEKAIILELEFDELPYSKKSYLEAVTIAKKFKLECHFELIKEIALNLDKAAKEVYEL